MTYTPEQLRYSGAASCRCGAGLAYPMNVDIQGAWECSKILVGEEKPSMDHDGPYPFGFWSIISESQKVRAGGATTRPGGHIDEERFEEVEGARKLPDYPDALMANPKAGRA